MGQRKIRLIVNAIPLANINTGIGRYLKCLYAHLERIYANRLDISYFDGNLTSRRLPQGPPDPDLWSRKVAHFWRLPAPVALTARLLLHLQREALFRKAARDHDLYHEAAFFPFAPSRGLKTVFTIHDLSLIRYPQFHPRERVLFTRLFFRRRCKKADSFLAVSDFTRQEMEDLLKISRSSIAVTHLACDPQIFRPRSPLEVQVIRDRFRLPRKYFLFLGTGDPRKNMEVVPRALKEAGLDIPLVIAGWSGWGGEIGEGHQANRLIRLGYVQDADLASLYSGALALVYPSLYEGFGLPLLEAMACGCPVISSRKASLPEVAGDAALYMDDPFDAEELSLLLRELSSSPDLGRDLAQKGLTQASRFSWEKAARETFQAFEKVLF